MNNIDNFNNNYEDDLNTFLEEIGNDILENKNDIEKKICILCEQIFKNRFNLIRHLQNNKSKCKKKKLENLLLKK